MGAAHRAVAELPSLPLGNLDEVVDQLGDLLLGQYWWQLRSRQRADIVLQWAAIRRVVVVVVLKKRLVVWSLRLLKHLLASLTDGIQAD